MHSHYLNGQWIAGDGPQLAAYDPSTGLQTWNGHAATIAEVDAACKVARAAFEAWAMQPLDVRAGICQRFRDLLKEHSEELATLISIEVGKPLWEARTEVTTMANKVDISLQSYHARTGVSQSKVADGDAVLRHRPHGVFAVFGPYNFPGHLPNGHIVPALIAGNTIVFKPSEYAPQTAIRTVELWIKAGLPEGVLNLVNGARDTGAALAANTDIDGILFTGSYQTGAILHRQFAGQPGKMLALEMGGNNALVAWDVEDVDAAVHHTIFSAFVSAGQRCTCARKLIVEDSAKGGAIVDRLVEVASKIAVGRYDKTPAPFMGPVVSTQVAHKLVQAHDDLVARGGKSLLPMRLLQEGTGFVSPGIVDVSGVEGIPDEEWFGPLLQVIRVASFDEAVREANATQYGLAAGLLSDDPTLWQSFLVRARAGIVNWNRPTTGAASTAPFGGIGKSGNHRPSAYYAADYCAYPVASIENSTLDMPKQLSPGLAF
ncbi:succinylglutamate-semialdehyde dehydrogenase [Noviherbaspirillum denitrificans]|uniref:N-succinylglutamate 5-semialdehyde dehydrogenase n=1 Tax=Noviherbaspirillum denitrificans TaxID=1968433 RepID=A0A254TIU0_9BURK|nr:succinylglutamate-semialdehyde dehydrogenase [Noviherbaspirillum denitrificans]OWW19618.1 N-succinylglutamate 5-semialdehyde dehydrogenase [Noviherbaspirillum denitrificans]